MDLDGFTITKREVMASVSIVAVLLLIGLLISNEISNHQLDQNEVYNKAVKIEDSDLFSYGMRTNIGNAFVYGELETVDPVSYPEIDGTYMCIEKVKEKYTKHTRTVTTRDKKGHTKTEKETYWTWDTVGREEQCCKQVRFSGMVFPSSKFNLPSSHYIDTLKESRLIRYKYYGTDTTHTGTVFTELKDGTVSDHTEFYKDCTIEETIRMLESLNWSILFWIFWAVLVIVCVFGFYYLDNKCLE